MSNSGGSGGGGSGLTQGLLAARPAPSPNSLYFATDSGEWWIGNAAGNAWQSIASTSALAFQGGTTLATNAGSSLGFTRNPGTGGLKLIGGSLEISAVQQGLNVKEGTNCRQGVATLVAGTVTVANVNVTAVSRIFITPQETGTLTGIPRVSARVVGTSFTITSTVGTDTATFAWEIFEPA